MSEPRRALNPKRQHVLVVGGSPAVRLAWCRLLGERDLDVSLLRWEEPSSPAEWSRHCDQALWLGNVDDGVRQWSQALGERLSEGPYTDVLPVDALALAVLCGNRLPMPPGVHLAGPQPASVWESGVDRVRVFEFAREVGWSVPTWQHVVDPDISPYLDRALIVRPRWDVRIVADKPQRFSTKRVMNAAELDAKLRDDVPRGEVLLQAAPSGRVVRLCFVVCEGQLLGCWRWPAGPQPDTDDVLRRRCADALVQRLGWTGVIELEIESSESGHLLLDVHFGGQSGFAELVRDGRWGTPRLNATNNANLFALVSRPAPHRRFDPLPRLASPLLSLRATLAKARLRLRATLASLPGPVRRPIALNPHSSVLVVCKGNINRSIVAEQMLRAAGFKRTASAGLLDFAGRRPSWAAEVFLAETLHQRPGTLRSRSLSDVLSSAVNFDVVLCFERRHLVEIASRYPALRDRIHLLNALAPALGGPIDIADPHGGSAEDYRACFARIQAIVVAATGGPRSAPESPCLL